MKIIICLDKDDVQTQACGNNLHIVLDNLIIALSKDAAEELKCDIEAWQKEQETSLK